MSVDPDTRFASRTLGKAKYHSLGHDELSSDHSNRKLYTGHPRQKPIYRNRYNCITPGYHAEPTAFQESAKLGWTYQARICSLSLFRFQQAEQQLLRQHKF